MNESLQTVFWLAGGIAAISAAAGVVWKIFASMATIREGVKSLLRKQMLETYYKCLPTREIRQYRYETFMLSYQAYKALGGNSFIDRIKEEIDEFSIVA